MVNEGMKSWPCGDLRLPTRSFPFRAASNNDLDKLDRRFRRYVKVYLWSLYFYEHFGGQPNILDLVSQPVNS